MTGTTKTVSLGPFTPGMNNRRPDFKLAERAANGASQSFVRSAVNADITAEGTLKRRPGYELAIAGDDCHSLWANGTAGFFVDYDTLVQIGGTPPVAADLRTDMTPGRLVSYAEAAGDIYYSNGVVIGRIRDNAVYELGVPMMMVPPTVAASTGGSLPGGDYMMCFTQHNADGEESGSTIPVQVTVPDNGRILVTGLPTTLPDGVFAISIYVTAANDGTLLRLARVTAASSTFTYAARATLGARCATLLLTPMPAGNIVREINGRLLVASGAVLYYSEPYAYALTNPARNYVVFPAPITMIECLPTGFFIAADKTYWVPGDIVSTTLDQVLPFGAVPGASGRDGNEEAVLWMTPQGMVRGTPDGNVARLQEENVAVDKAQTGAFLHREHDGMKQALAGLFGTSTGVAATSFIEAEVIRKATVL
jgi:hypothetical protein